MRLIRVVFVWLPQTQRRLKGYMASVQLDDGEHHCTWLMLWGRHVVHSLPTCVFLVALSVLVHPLLENFPFSEWMARNLAAAVHEAKMLRDVRPAAKVNVFELDAVSSRALEVTTPLPPELIARFGGDRPLDRCKAAEMLSSLAKHAASANVAEPFNKVLAIDFDVTPILPDSDSGTGARPAGSPEACTLKRQIDSMAEALDALRRQFAVVIMVALPRPITGEERINRRTFLQRARCTVATDAGASASGPPGKLYVASALLYASPEKIHSQYFDELKPEREFREPERLSANALQLPPYFPSLGRLLRFFVEGNKSDSALKSLQSQCVLVTPTGDAGVGPALTEEAVVDDAQRNAAESLQDFYRLAYIDWGTTTDGRVDGRGIRVVTPAESAASASYALHPIDLMGAPWPKVTVLMVNTGANSDRHATSSGVLDMPGGTIHAAIAASKSIRPAKGLLEVLADFGAGVAYVAIWAALGLKLGAIPADQVDGLALRKGRATWQSWRYVVVLVVLAVVLMLVAVAVLLVFGGWPQFNWTRVFGDVRALGGVGMAAPFVGCCLLAGALGLGLSAATWVDGVLFGQLGQPLQNMPWLERKVREMLPLAVGLLMVLTTVAASLASMLRTEGGYFFDAKVMLLGLLVHSYMEAANRDGAESTEHHACPPASISWSMLRRLREGNSCHKLDAWLQLSTWIAVMLGAVYVSACEHH